MNRKQTNRQTIIITGASSGIGKVTAQLLAEQGFRVFGTSRRKLPDENGIEMLELDVRSDESIQQCISKIKARSDKIDILINNAGIEHLGIAEETTMEEIYSVFETNLFGVVRMTNAVLPMMRTRKSGKIINIGSLAAWVGEPGEAFYSASKSALAGYTEALRHELWPLGIDVSLLEPGAFKTNVINAAAGARNNILDYDAIRFASHHTLKKSMEKGGDPLKVAELILKITQTRSPLLRYGAGSGARWLPYLKLLLPQRMFDTLLRLGFGLKKG